MITHVHIQNFRSFLDAKVDLQPFSLVVGANGSGKTNFLRFFEVVSKSDPQRIRNGWVEHTNGANVRCGFRVELDGETDRGFYSFQDSPPGALALSDIAPWSDQKVAIFSLITAQISESEKVQPNASVAGDGAGVTQVLDMLKNGDREDLFDAIEAQFRRYVPEVEKLSLQTVVEGRKRIQVREKGLKRPTPGPELSEGTRLILAILTILHQEKPPPIILLEDIDRGVHPRLFEYMAPLMKDIAVRMDVNIIATTHNPYLVDAFQDDKKAVIIVEKEDGASTLTTLEDKLEGLNYDDVNPDDLPLGQLWYSGLVGGVPKKIDLATKA